MKVIFAFQTNVRIYKIAWIIKHALVKIEDRPLVTNTCVIEWRKTYRICSPGYCWKVV